MHKHKYDDGTYDDVPFAEYLAASTFGPRAARRSVSVQECSRLPR